MRDTKQLRKALRAAHGAGAAGLLALAAALFATLPARATGDTLADHSLDASNLVRFARLCEATDGLDRGAAVRVAAGAGFRTVDWIEDDISAFYARRDAAFAHRDESNGMMLDDLEGVFKSHGHSWDAYFVDRDGTLAILRAESVLALINDMPVGDGHVCQFFGQGWIDEADAEAEIAMLFGEDFGGRGRTIPPSSDWRNRFSGFELGPRPRGTYTVTTVMGVPDAIPASFTFGYVVENDMTIPPEVFEDQ